MTNIAKETEPKKYDKAYVVEDDMLWEVFGDGYSKAQVIWDKENICELLNNLHQKNQELKERNAHNFAKKIELMKDNEQLRQLYKVYEKAEEVEEKAKDCLIQELKKKNEQLRQSIDSMIETSAEISNRNVLLHEQLGETQFNHKQCEKKVKELEQKLDWICEQTGFDGVKFHYINKEVVQ